MATNSSLSEKDFKELKSQYQVCKIHVHIHLI